jgi:hypothetical protein
MREKMNLTFKITFDFKLKRMCGLPMSCQSPISTYIHRQRPKPTQYGVVFMCVHTVYNTVNGDPYKGRDFETCSFGWVSIPMPYFKQWGHSISTPAPPSLCSIRVFEL